MASVTPAWFRIALLHCHAVDISLVFSDSTPTGSSGWTIPPFSEPYSRLVQKRHNGALTRSIHGTGAPPSRNNIIEELLGVPGPTGYIYNRMSCEDFEVGLHSASDKPSFSKLRPTLPPSRHPSSRQHEAPFRPTTICRCCDLPRGLMIPPVFVVQWLDDPRHIGGAYPTWRAPARANVRVG
ncbi:hypothetical protein C8Q79DRAFT_465233 [Trametes meyenii]|nr:hypothetical protein C8Q79DRAFT_465233 [Trametes meyenii]